MVGQKKTAHGEQREGRARTRPSAGKVTTGPANKPPIRQKSTKYTIKRLRLRIPDVQQAEAVADQQGLEYVDLSREEYQRGVLVDSALRPPGDDGRYGLYEGPRLAELLRHDLDGLISFALQQGVVPTLIQEYRLMMRERTETLSCMQTHVGAVSSTTPPTALEGNPAPGAVTEVAEEAQDVLSMFFSGEGLT